MSRGRFRVSEKRSLMSNVGVNPRGAKSALGCVVSAERQEHINVEA